MTNFTIGRIAFGPAMLEIEDLSPADPTVVFSWFETLVSGLGIIHDTSEPVPVPCFDVDELHRRNAEILKRRG
jgi:hypothetical protein